ncbi:unnamed protein product [Psylliodes chrysocephalus]|uniref:Uncharacterized protein n=1 Tax=Psylliodes chrysocephalus TaxID=3402493 RepID=A0A9P0G3M7_9CUCU|nr:unnamed protein product [Psylliodes chrysocephala]
MSPEFFAQNKPVRSKKYFEKLWIRVFQWRGTDIQLFKESYEALGISVTPKIHAIFFHVSDFCLKTWNGLGFYSEQAIESLHHDFCVTWTNYKVLKEHPQYNAKLLRVVCDYNIKHL